MTSLPSPTNDSSRFRRALAQQLTHRFNLQPNEEIALTGSVARGVADRFSDIEIRFLVDALELPDIYDVSHVRLARQWNRPHRCGTQRTASRSAST